MYGPRRRRRVLNPAVAVANWASDTGTTIQVFIGSGIVARECTIAILKAEERGLDAAKSDCARARR